MKLQQYIDKTPSVSEALALFNLNGSDVTELLHVANKVREKYCGNNLQVTSLTNAKSGECTEDCGFCSQSVHYQTKIQNYSLKDKNIIIDEFDKAIAENGADTF